MHDEPANGTTTAVDSESHNPQRKIRFTKLGIALILLSGVSFFSMLAVPWLPLTGANKAILAGTLFISTQVAWWVGAAMAGPAVIKKMMFWQSP